MQAPTFKKSENATSQHYRPDIDGLRCIAISAVLLFHLNPKISPGGFLGVDVFFVISGYLITISLIDRGYSDFYIRRINRLFPALIATILATALAGWFVLFQDEFKSLGKHLRASAIFLQNINLSREAGYFDRASELKPLLHLWSLAIEEQFYIFWPLIIASATKIKRVGASTITLLAASLTYACWLSAKGDSNYAFFNLLSRAWEPLIGCALALFIKKSGTAPHKNKGNLFTATGAVAILTSIILIDSNSSQIPGLLSIPAALGSAAIIYGGNSNGWTTLILGHPILRYIGKISYPLYLIHWPVITYKNILVGPSHGTTILLGCLAVSLALASALHHFVENPTHKYCKNNRNCTYFLAGAMVGVILLGSLIHSRSIPPKAPPAALTDELQSMNLGGSKGLTIPKCGSLAPTQLTPYCATDKRWQTKMAVWGDSKADAIFWSLVEHSQAKTGGWTIMGLYGCSPMSGTLRTRQIRDVTAVRCNAANKAVLDALVASDSISTVLIATASRLLLQGDYVSHDANMNSDDAATQGLSQAVAILQAKGKQVLLLEDNPTIIDAPILCTSRHMMLSWPDFSTLAIAQINQSCSISYSDYLKKFERYKYMLRLISKKTGAQIIRTDDINCNLAEDTCSVRQPGSIRYSYGDHYSDAGASPIARRIIEKVMMSRALVEIN